MIWIKGIQFVSFQLKIDLFKNKYFFMCKLFPSTTVIKSKQVELELIAESGYVNEYFCFELMGPLLFTFLGFTISFRFWCFTNLFAAIVVLGSRFYTFV